MTNFEVTPDIVAASDALTDWADNHPFGEHWSLQDSGEYDLYAIVSAEFEVCHVLAALGHLDLTIEFGFSPGAAWNSERIDMEALAALATSPEFGDPDSAEPEGFPEVVEEFGEEAVKRAIMFAMDNITGVELVAAYFQLEAVSETNAVAQLVEYLRHLDAVDRAMRAAGWEL
jgi:hypothetical protein